jgi:hypothetical protein
MFYDPLIQSQNSACAFPSVKETIPRSSLGYASNNVYAGFPPVMSDGRPIIASFQPEAVMNTNLLKDSGVKSNWEYRKYLTSNAQLIMEQNYIEACNDTGYMQRFTPMERSFNDDKVRITPFIYPSYLDASEPKGYENTDLKSLYLTREQLNARKSSAVVTQAELIKMLG